MIAGVFRDSIVYGDVFLVTGTQHGYGSDGEPVLRNIQIIKRLSLDEIYFGDARTTYKPEYNESLTKEENEASLKRWQQTHNLSNVPLSKLPSMLNYDHGDSISKSMPTIANKTKLEFEEITQAFEGDMFRDSGLFATDEDEEIAADLVNKLGRNKLVPDSNEYKAAMALKNKMWQFLVKKKIKSKGGRVSPIM